MDFILSSGVLILVLVCFVAPGIILAIVVGYFITKTQLKTNSTRSSLSKSGVTEPAIVISARNNYFTGGGKNRPSNAVHVTFEVEVQPADQPPFKAKFDESLPIRAGDNIGERLVQQQITLLGMKISF